MQEFRNNEHLENFEEESKEQGEPQAENVEYPEPHNPENENEDSLYFDEGNEEDEDLENNEDDASPDGELTEEERIKKEEDEKVQESLEHTASHEPPNRFNPERMYDTRERQVSIEALQMLYDARNPNHRGVLKYPVAKLDEYNGELCAIVYIPDVYTGVEGILRKERAGLSRHENMESLLSYPYIRVTPEWIDRESGQCELNRALAEQISASRAWKNYNEGDDVDEAIVLGVQRKPGNRKPINIIVDVHGVEGIMRITEVSHNFVEDVKYKRGDVIPVRIIGKNENTGRFTVSRRARYFNPWSNEHYIPRIGDPYPGIIEYQSEQFLHVMLHTGIKVLAPRPSFNYKGRDRVREGEKVTVHITFVDRDQRVVFGNMSKPEAKKQINFNRKIGKISEMPQNSLILQE